MLQKIEHIKFLDKNNFFLIAGPCVIESKNLVYEVAGRLKEITDKLEIPFIFKSSYRKANRTKIDSFSGIGDERGLHILRDVRKDLQIPVLTDIHSPHEARHAGKIVDALQIPAFLARQTDIIVAAAKTGKYVNIKKGQFMSPDSMKFAVEKVLKSGNEKVMLTERGTMFGYSELIVDFVGFKRMQEFNVPVVMDITHSLQRPNQATGVSGGNPDMIETIGRAGIAVGADGIFIETHPDPKMAKSDAHSMLKMDKLEDLLSRLVELRNTVNGLNG